MTQDDAIMQAVPWLLAALGGGGILRALYVAHRAAKAMETVEALDKLVRGNGGDDWSFPETRRQVAEQVIRSNKLEADLDRGLDSVRAEMRALKSQVDRQEGRIQGQDAALARHAKGNEETAPTGYVQHARDLVTDLERLVVSAKRGPGA